MGIPSSWLASCENLDGLCPQGNRPLAIAQVVAEQLNGQPVLFRHCEAELQEQLQMAERLSKHLNIKRVDFNYLPLGYES